MSCRDITHAETRSPVSPPEYEQALLGRHPQSSLALAAPNSMSLPARRGKPRHSTGQRYLQRETPRAGLSHPSAGLNHIIPPSSELCRDSAALLLPRLVTQPPAPAGTHGAARHPAGRAPTASLDRDRSCPAPSLPAKACSARCLSPPARLIKNNDVLGVGSPDCRRFPGR